MNNNKHAVVNSKNSRTSSMTWAGGGHCQNEVKLQRERERDFLTCVSCTFHDANPACRNVLRSQTSSMMWLSSSLGKVFATCGLCLLRWHLEHSGSSGYMKKPKKLKMSAMVVNRFPCHMSHGSPRHWSAPRRKASVLRSSARSCSNSITFQIVKSGNWKNRW